MSAADVAAVDVALPRRVSTRFFRSELWLIFGRRRNWVGMAVLTTVPILLIIAVKVSPPSGGEGPDFVNQITQNGVFAALAALTLEMPLFLPVAERCSGWSCSVGVRWSPCPVPHCRSGPASGACCWPAGT